MTNQKCSTFFLENLNLNIYYHILIQHEKYIRMSKESSSLWRGRPENGPLNFEIRVLKIHFFQTNFPTSE